MKKALLEGRTPKTKKDRATMVGERIGKLAGSVFNAVLIIVLYRWLGWWTVALVATVYGHIQAALIVRDWRE